MITKISQSLQNSVSWQAELAQAIRDPKVLLARLELDPDLLRLVNISPDCFPLKVTDSFVARMERGNANDPLLRQVLPLNEESVPWGQDDPVGDHQAMASPGVLHKYHGRVLLVSTAACGVHCRYCFRRHFPYQQANPLGKHLPATLAYLRSHPDIREVILSGGDPLSLSDDRLASIVAKFNDISHLTTLRIHSRLPVVLPSRIQAQMFDWLAKCRLNIVLVLHINHPNEINDELRQAIALLRQQNLTLLNQAVLLKGINDSVQTQVQLSNKLLDCGIQPYYLHQLDKVSGAAHFEVPVADGLELMEQMRQQLPGYLIPRYVREIPGQKAKTPL